MAQPWLVMDASAGGFLTAVKKAATLPPNTRFTADVLRRMADAQMRTRIAPALLKAGGEHLGFTVRIAVPAGRAKVRLPARAMRLRGLSLEVPGRKPTPLERVDSLLEDATATGTPRLYALEGSAAVRLFPVPASACTLVARVYQHPSAHVDPAECGAVAAFDAGARTLTLADAPPAAFVQGALVDVLCGQPDFQWLACDVAVEEVAGSVVTLASVPEDVAVGDYLCLAGETPVPQAPVAFHAVLVHAVAAECLRGQTDGEGFAMQEAALLQAEASARESIAPTSHQPVTPYQGDFL